MRAIRLVLALSMALALSLPAAALGKVRPGDRADDFRAVRDGSGRKLRLERYRGKVVVLTFGASWCKPCAKELPAYEKLSKKYSKKDVVFVAVNIDTTLAKGKRFMRKSGLKNVVAAYDPRKTAVASWEPPTMPSTFIIDRKGIVRYLHKGFESGDEKEIARRIARYE